MSITGVGFSPNYAYFAPSALPNGFAFSPANSYRSMPSDFGPARQSFTSPVMNPVINSSRLAASYQPYVSPQQAYERLKQNLDGKLLNASRISFDINQLTGLPEGAIIAPKNRMPSFPKTGFPLVDQSVRKIDSTVSFIFGSIQETVSSVLKGSLVGAGASAVVSGLGALVMVACEPAAQRVWMKSPMAAAFGGLLGGCVGAVGGLCWGLIKSLKDLKNILTVA